MFGGLILDTLNLGGTFLLLLTFVRRLVCFWLVRKGFERRREDAFPCVKIEDGLVQSGRCTRPRLQRCWRGSGCGGML
jgi:hypothetical protein